MMNKVKNLLKKYKNKILTFVCVIACIPLFSISSFAYTGYDFVPLTNSTSFVFVNSSGGVIQSGSCDYSSVNNLYTLSNSSVSGLIGIDIDCNTTFNIAVDVSNFDYYLVCSIYGSAPSISNFTFMCEDFNANANDHNNKAIGLIYGNSKKYYHFDTEDIKGFSVSGKLDFSTYSNISGLAFYTSVAGTVPANLKFEAAILSVPKDTSSENVQSIISAINNQTSTLGGKIDDTNNFIDKGNSSTGGIVSNFQDKDDELNEVVSQYRDVENQFFEDFNTNQSAITSDIVGWSWGGLVNCADWVGATLTDYYNNMGDFRQYIIYPLMLGIALFFFGRGGSIIGHLFRKPTQTTVNTKSVFRREGNTRYTTTTTSREGGVFRK